MRDPVIVCKHCGAEVWWSLPQPEDPCFACDRPIARDVPGEPPVEAKADPLVEAALVLEVLCAQIQSKPYRELSPDFQKEIVRVTGVVREAVASRVPS